MVLKLKKGAHVLPKAEAKAKTFKVKKAVLKGIHSHKNKKGHTSPTFQQPKTLWLWGLPKCSQKSNPQEKQVRRATLRRNKVGHDAVTIPLTTESAMKKIEDNNTLVYIKDVKANKHQIKQAVKKVCAVDVANVNTLLQPDGEKAACVGLAPGYDTLDVANKIGFIQTESNWLIINTHFVTIEKR
ncbi:60S ribosomal protein L23a [Tupaia chinensis]|uniref:60S ribosomal protein L23a n=1 Tax=Tupaia chinensis TaxID=246437 RepID=L9L729_TUPCH|nr:60S ribosomal protein L23a [Tupaia chinensis]